MFPGPLDTLWMIRMSLDELDISGGKRNSPEEVRHRLNKRDTRGKLGQQGEYCVRGGRTYQLTLGSRGNRLSRIPPEQMYYPRGSLVLLGMELVYRSSKSESEDDGSPGEQSQDVSEKVTRNVKKQSGSLYNDKKVKQDEWW